jgi:multidrug efflux system membrane fusion protein
MSRRVIVGGLVAAAVIGYGAWRWLEPPAQAQAPVAPPPAIPVDIATASRGDLPIYLDGLGTVQAFNTVTVRARVDGELQKVAYTEGQTVKAGDVLALIDPRPFQAALDQAIAKQAQDEAQLANVKRDLQRFRDIHEFATRQSVDTQTALVAQDEALIKGDQAAIENARVQLGYTTIAAPLTGRTGIRLVDQGNIVHATDTGGLVIITQLQPISVIFTLPEGTLPAIAGAMAHGAVEARAISQDSATELDRGTIALVDNEIDQTTGTIRLKATFANRDSALWPGQFVTIRVLVRAEHGVVTVPAGAVQHGALDLYAYVVKPDQSVERRTIQVGPDDGDKTVITAGVQPGEAVVTGGQYRLQPGARIVAQRDAAAQTASALAGAPKVAP